MQAASDQRTKLIATKPIGWNGLRLAVPAVWETRVAAPCHLVFEDEFQPLLQLRWHKNTRHSPKELKQTIAAFSKQADTIIPKSELTSEWRQLEINFQILACSGDKKGIPTSGLFCCPQCRTLFQFQVFPEPEPTGKSIADCLATLSCHGHEEQLWRIQDFSLIMPQPFCFVDCSFLAGLTRLSFHAGHLTLETCKLAPADARLSRQSLAEILLTLAAAPDLEICETKEQESIEGFRNPGIADRILLRMRRCKPFVQAKIWHDRPSNRLLALVLTGSRPIPDNILPTVAGSYEII